MISSGSDRSPGRGLVARVGVLLAGLAIASLALGPVVAAATLTSAWQAKIGSGGVNGTAKIQAFDNGTGSLTFKLRKLRTSTLLPVVLRKGTCGSTGAALFRPVSIKTTSKGVVSRTSSLTAAQVSLLKRATAGTGKIAIRVGSAATGGIKCGLFAAVAVPPPVAKVTATIPVGAFPTAVISTPQVVFVANSPDWSIMRVDPTYNSLLSEIQLDLPGPSSGIHDLAFAEGSLWAAIGTSDASGTEVAGSVLRLDPVSGQTIATIPVGKLPLTLTATPGAIWVANYEDGSVMRIDTATNAVTATVALGGRPDGLAYDFGSIWVANEADGKISRIDPATNTVVATIPTLGAAEDLTTAAGAVWVANYGTRNTPTGLVSKIDPATNQVVRSIPVLGNPIWINAGGGSLWVSMDKESAVVRVSLATPDLLVSRIQLTGPAFGIAATDHTAWVTVPVPPPDGSSVTPPGSLVRIDY